MDLLLQAHSRFSPFNLKEGCAKRIQKSGYVTFAVYIHVFQCISNWWVGSSSKCKCVYDALRRKSNAGEGFFEVKKRHAKDSTRTPTSKSSPFAAPNLAPMLIINETPQVQAHDGDHVGLWQGERWSVTPQQRPHTSTGVEFEDGGLWQVRV